MDYLSIYTFTYMKQKTASLDTRLCAGSLCNNFAQVSHQRLVWTYAATRYCLLAQHLAVLIKLWVTALVCLFKGPSQPAVQFRYISQQMPQRFGDSLHH